VDDEPRAGEWMPFHPAPPHTADEGAKPPAYRHCIDDTVEFRGRLRLTDGGQYTTGCDWQLGTMPPEWRPDVNCHRIVAVEMGASVYYARLEAGTDGTLTANVPPGATSTTQGLHWIALDGFTYPLPKSAATT